MKRDDLMEALHNFYVAIVAGALFVYESNKEKPFVSRFMITLSSAGFGFSLGPSVATYIGGPLPLTGLIITALGFLVLELLTALFSDRQFIKEIFMKWISK
jgi:hypothetical protein